GFLAREDGADRPGFSDVRLDLEHEPSGVASAVFDAAPFAVYDTIGSTRVSPRLIAAFGAKSAAYIPVVADSRVVAVFVVLAIRGHRAFAPDDLMRATELAARVRPALEHARLAGAPETEAKPVDSERRLEQQAALLRAAQALAAELRLETVLQRLVDEVAQLLDADAADCYLLDPGRGVLRCAAVHGMPSELVGFEFPASRGTAAEAIESGGPVVVADYASVERPVPHDAYAGFTDAIVTSMTGSSGTLGVVGVGRRGGSRPFEAGDADVLGAFAGLASLAVRNADAFEQRSRQARVQRGFYRIASVLGAPLSLVETLDAIAFAATEALGGTFAAVLMPGGRAGGLQLVGSHNVPAVLTGALERGLPGAASALHAAATEGRVLAAPAIANDERFEGDWQALAEQIRCSSLLAVPVASPRQPSGGLVIVFFAEGRDFSDDDLELAGHLGDATRGALERSELFEAERTARSLAQQLARIGSLLATELDPAAVLDEVVQQAPALLGVDACTIRVLDGDELVVSAAEGAGAAAAIGSRASSSAWLSGDVVQSRAPVAVDDVADDPRLLAADSLLESGYDAYLGVPLVGPEGSLHGVLSVYGRDPRRWLEEEIEALVALAANTSAALSNAELYQRVALERERSVAILANIADGIVAVDREGRVVLWNAAAEQITGVPGEEALGREPATVLRRSLESGGEAPPGDRLVSIQRGGEEVWLSVTEAVMRDPAGIVAGRIFAFRDISADRLVEQMKSDFVSTVSHELRTPLTSIYGFAETLLRRDVQFDEAERVTFLGYIASEAERLTGIVDALLNVARLDTGDLQVNFGAVDVGSIVSEIVAAVEQAAPSGHSFVLELPAEPLAADADADKLRQVVTQLVDNAVKYSPRGGTVTVAAARKDERVEVRVADEGVGIPQSEQRRIFRKFYRADHTMPAGGTNVGTGLGLFIAEGLVTAMGGRIWVESREGEGSSFAFDLPLARPALVEE
ncbi:MAG: hypothetical protein QOE36_1813, partial [Gaiellaceae bacterium]|nr:hypothetical protein [Gaiellaceae bacterium]